MSLSALVAAFEGERGVVAATLPIAGVSLIERQLHRLQAAGVARVVVLADTLGARLAHEIGRLRGEGAAIETVTNLADAAERLSGDERVLVLIDGCLPSQSLIDRTAAAPVPALVTVADDDGLARYERIDAVTRWAGIALLDGGRLLETAAMVGEWDPISTLLRRAVQEGAARVEAAVPPLLVADEDALDQAEIALIDGSRIDLDGWSARWIEAPLAERLLMPLLARGISAPGLAWGAAALNALGAAGALLGWRWGALVPLLVAGPLVLLAMRLAAIRARPLREQRLLGTIRAAALALAGLGLGFGLAQASRQWGWLLLATLPLAGLPALAWLRRLAGRLDAGPPPRWSMRPGDMPWLVLPFAVAGGLWGAGLAVVALTVVASIGERIRALDAAFLRR